jgi:hypothetical protein
VTAIAPNPPLAAALAMLPDSCSVDDLDVVWVFPARTTGGRESGLAVLELVHRPAAGPPGRRICTVRYQTGSRRGRSADEVVWEECGVCPAERVERVVQGVTRRLALEVQPAERVVVGRDAAAWTALLAQLGGAIA